MQAKRQKQLSAVALTGTYAWQSISQKAKNVVVSEGNPGGRLHDDFNGSSKAVYVENFTAPEEGGLDLFIRVRLDEYLEIGEDAGKNLDDPQRKAEPLVEGTDIGDETTWVTHIPNNAADPFHTYWRWNFGGSTVFMPTFNKDRDSLDADINGTFEGPDGDPATDADRYDDYHEYQLGETNRIPLCMPIPTEALRRWKKHIRRKPHKRRLYLRCSSGRTAAAPSGLFGFGIRTAGPTGPKG